MVKVSVLPPPEMCILKDVCKSHVMGAWELGTNRWVEMCQISQNRRLIFWNWYSSTNLVTWVACRSRRASHYSHACWISNVIIVISKYLSSARIAKQDINGRILTVNKAAPRGSRPERPRVNEPSFRIYVGNLPWQVDDARLEQVFSEHGKVVNARVISDQETGRSRGFGFVTMSSETELQDAIAALDGQVTSIPCFILSWIIFSGCSKMRATKIWGQ